MRLAHKTRVVLIGACALLVALIATAFAIGGSGSKESAGPALTRANGLGGVAVGSPAGLPPVFAHGSAAKRAPVPAVGAPPALAPQVGSAPVTSSEDQSALPGAAAATSGGGTVVADGPRSLVPSSSSLAATRIVKTGNVEIRVAKRDVQAVTDKLNLLATAEGGYVSQSNTELGAGAPSSEVVLRVPVAHFQDAITAAEKLGTHVISVSTSAADVTGKYVDLSARMHALERTRSTYLSILSRARTIGATLAVQQRIDDVQQQIDRLHGQLKLLGNQSSYSTLTVDVVPSGVAALAKPDHQRHGIGKAWHDSWSRFSRGVDAMVGAIGPIVFALLLFAVLALIGWFGNRTVRRMTADRRSAATQP